MAMFLIIHSDALVKDSVLSWDTTAAYKNITKYNQNIKSLYIVSFNELLPGVERCNDGKLSSFNNVLPSTP